jgi:hypothetical protein
MGSCTSKSHAQEHVVRIVIGFSPNTTLASNPQITAENTSNNEHVANLLDSVIKNMNDLREGSIELKSSPVINDNTKQTMDKIISDTSQAIELTKQLKHNLA